MENQINPKLLDCECQIFNFDSSDEFIEIEVDHPNGKFYIQAFSKSGATALSDESMIESLLQK